VIPPLADGAGSPVDQGVSTFLFIGALLFGWIFVWRIRGRAFAGLPVAAAWLSGAAGVACIVLAFVLPPIIRPDVTTRPTTSARIVIERPRRGEVFTGHPARVPVRVRVVGGKVVPIVSTHLIPNEGHVHLFLDRRLVTMTFTTRRVLSIPPGHYRLQAEFVAVDHGPFNPRVLAATTFTVRR
jgi:hypothetical protein